MNRRRTQRGRVVQLVIGLLGAGMIAPVGNVAAEQLTYEQAMETALRRSGRSEMISGNLEVAERKYHAERSNFYFPEISINGSLPTYSSRELYTFPEGGGGEKEVGLRKSFDMNAFIGLNQNLITGGKLDFRAYLQGNSREYPNRIGLTADETERLGTFSLDLEQPLLQPSQAKNDLHNRRDDLEIARLTRREETATLQQELAEAYIGALALDLNRQIAQEKLRSANLKVAIDTVKLQDGVISEEGWLESSSARLDAELAVYDAISEWSRAMQDLAIILDLESYDNLELVPPAVLTPLDSAEQERLLAASDRAIPIQKAEFEYRKAERAAGFASSSSGLNGTLSASYAKDAGNVETRYLGSSEEALKNTLNLDAWEVKLEFSYPIWDGGSGAAEVRASEIEAKRAQIEVERQRKIVRAEIRNLTEGIDVGYRKLAVLDQQIAVTKNRLDIAKGRLDNGEISEIEYFEASVQHLEARKKYIEELKNYLVDRYALEGKFTS